MFRFTGTDLTDLERSSAREWVLSNGRGAYASSTLANVSTRRYHGLLVAGARPLADRRLLVAKLSEAILDRVLRIELGCNKYPDVIHPKGHELLEEVDAGGCVVRHLWRLKSGALERRVAMARDRDVTAVVYRWIGPEPVTLELRPLTACRAYHHCQREHAEFDGSLVVQGQRAVMRPYPGGPEIHFGFERGEVTPLGVWYYNLQYDRERIRGLDFEEDLFCPGRWAIELVPEVPVGITLATVETDGAEAHSILGAAETHEAEVIGEGVLGGSADTRVRALLVAADSFVARRDSGQTTIVAGFHWFTDWGRDAMIALPGITLPQGRLDLARSVIEGFAAHMSQGIIPNRFPDHGEAPDYNTVDATLMMFVAAKRVVDALAPAERRDFVAGLWPALTDSIDWHVRGTLYGIQVDPEDGLLRQGDAYHQLTWMDAKVGDWVVTPRAGKPVEIAALWFNALMIAAEFGELLGESEASERFGLMAERAKASFEGGFWHEEGGYYGDVLTPSGLDTRLRCNQAIALALPYEIADRTHVLSALRVMEEKLLTPMGLRTLSPDEPDYRGIYIGAPQERDAAYHSGTVWAWPIGSFLRAYLRVHEETAEAKDQVRAWLEPLLEHVGREGCVGSINEIFDAEPPHTPRGAVSQAWSVAEVLDVLAQLQRES
ncbi:MAG: glycogen debranching enzyme family protein [Armatimonadetes bacterium]|jgi:predicted glycogen debranching enzyme|nr:glycogen debranching enzyme family protein [Armatimonadota bacterium]